MCGCRERHRTDSLQRWCKYGIDKFSHDTGCPRIGDPNLSVHKMRFFWVLWPVILDLEISHIYILKTTSRFSNISIKNSLFGTYILVEIWLIWVILGLLCQIIWNKKHTVGLFDDQGPHSRCQFSHLIEKVINLGSKEHILWKKWSWEGQNCFKTTLLTWCTPLRPS